MHPVAEILNVHSALQCATVYTPITVKFCRPVSITVQMTQFTSPSYCPHVTVTVTPGHMS